MSAADSRGPRARWESAASAAGERLRRGLLAYCQDAKAVAARAWDARFAALELVADCAILWLALLLVCPMTG